MKIRGGVRVKLREKPRRTYTMNLYSSRKPHPFPAVEQWLSELESSEKDFREVLEYVGAAEDTNAKPIGHSVTRYIHCMNLAREVLAKHPLQQEVKEP